MEFFEDDFSPAPPPRKRRSSPAKWIALIAVALVAVAAVIVAMVTKPQAAQPVASLMPAPGAVRIEQYTNPDGSIRVTFAGTLPGLDPQMVYVAGFYYGLENGSLNSAGESKMIFGAAEADILAEISLPANQAGQKYQCLFFSYPLNANAFTINARETFEVLSPRRLTQALATPVPTIAPTATPSATPRPTVAVTPEPAFHAAVPTAWQFSVYPQEARTLYNQLNAREKELFAILYDGLWKVETEINVPQSGKYTEAELEHVLDVIRWDCPELMMLHETEGAGYTRIDDHVAAVRFPYVLTKAESDKAFEQSMAVIAGIQNQSDFGWTDYDHELAIYRYLLDHSFYDTELERSGYAEAPLLRGYGKCNGYASAFVLACRYYGIESFDVSGDTFDNGVIAPVGHMWSYVRLDGDWYLCDVTWDDPVGDRTGVPEAYYDCLKYFNVTDELYQARTVDEDILESFTLPKCYATYYDFYERTMTDVTVKGSWQDFLHNGLDNCLQTGRDYLIMRFENRMDYEMTMMNLEPEFDAWAKGRLRQWSWSWMSNPETLIVMVCDLDLVLK